MENSLWTFGCSFTAEYHPIDNDPPTTYDFYKEYNGGKLPKIWAEQLSEKLSLSYKNKGEGATSNARIFYTFCDWCSKFKKEDIVMVQWTTPFRFLLANSNSNTLCDILPSCKYPENEYDMEMVEAMMVNRANPVWVTEIIHYTKIINELCKEKGVNLFYWTYNEQDIWDYMEEKWEDFTYDNIITYQHNNNQRNLLQYLGIVTKDLQTIDAETGGKVKDAHLGKIGHKAQAEYFYNYIKKQI